VTVIGNEPTCEVVPERTPVDVLNEKPVGSVPVLDQVVVPVPPLCVNGGVKEVPAVPVVVAGSQPSR